MEGDSKQQKELKSFFSADKQRYTFYFDLAPEKAPLKVDLDLEARTLTEEALLAAIDHCNAQLRTTALELSTDIALYKVRLVGRNFKPKTDMPCLSLLQKICDLKISEFAVQIPNREKAIRPLPPKPKEQIEQLTLETQKLQVEEPSQPSQDHSTKP